MKGSVGFRGFFSRRRGKHVALKLKDISHTALPQRKEGRKKELKVLESG